MDAFSMLVSHPLKSPGSLRLLDNINSSRGGGVTGFNRAGSLGLSCSAPLDSESSKLGVTNRRMRVYATTSENKGASTAGESLNGGANNISQLPYIVQKQAEAMRAQLLETAGKAREELQQQANVVAEQLREQGVEKTAWQLKREAEIAAEELRLRTEKTRELMAESVHLTAEEAKKRLGVLTDDAPEPIKELATTAIYAHSKDAERRGAIIHDFCLGIPYGLVLATWGALAFLLTGSVEALRFGVGIGGILLAASIQSLQRWKKGKPTMACIAVEAGMTFVLLLKEAAGSPFSALPSLSSFLISAVMLGFFGYVAVSGGPPSKRTHKGLP
eukprot:TRINITY_DN38693_c0_g1_i1.p1 TRINITY_DN38693_c0_g1~~TRINITY_DN38693_c0_g1_i1.p1  ORF type:complete len:331 (-),score=59.76 TRINITY_DN38693_c0_g1_i1:359-1351(-)